jgi:thiamine transporter
LGALRHLGRGTIVQSTRIRVLVEIALTVALSAVLSMLAVRLPINFAGGTISLAMAPILVLALRRGVVAGVVAGMAFGAVDYFVEPFFVAPVQVALDYFVAFGAVGLAGLGSALYRRALQESPARAVAVAVPLMILGGAARLSVPWVSRGLFFGMNAPAGQPVWLYSIVYNATYVVPSLVICVAAAAAVLPALERAVPTISSDRSTASAA